MWCLLIFLVASLALAQPPPHGPRHMPPEFEKVLPPNIVQQLKQVDADTSLSPEQHHQKIDQIMSTVPGSVLAKLPPPPFIKDLPADVRAKVEQAHRVTSLSWSQRHQKIHAILDSLPPELRPHPPGPGGPHRGLPPGFKEVLPKEVLQQLQLIQDNDALTDEQKHEKSDKIFSSLPVEIVDKLPHPPFFKNLPKETQEQIKQIRRDKSMSWHERHQKIHAIIDALPDDIRPHHPPPGRHRGPPRGGELPPGFEEVLPEDIMQKVNDIRQNSGLSDEKKQEKVEDILSSLPVEILQKLPLPPFFEHLPDPVREKLTQIHRDTCRK
ncbi:hypothetical protein TELCIR_07675 [Teladorsagia circumcincta]|uniref:Uncharacterized protein n=1 Tax=Teladorsagia circumcincta TaxID=45464 RepID=A0A2G9UL65_TELCI|nr:hypothetical protein TELCIR_07675 [Teladorsagia circumcincta]